MVQTFLGGTLSFLIGGVPYRVAGNFKYKLGGIVRKNKEGLTGPLGFTTEYASGEIDCELVMDGTFTLASLKGLAGTDMVAALDNGQTILFPNAWQSGDDPQVDVKEAQVSIKFSSLTAQEL